MIFNSFNISGQISSTHIIDCALFSLEIRILIKPTKIGEVAKVNTRSNFFFKKKDLKKAKNKNEK